MAKKFQTNQNLVNAGFQQLSGQTLSLSGNTLIGNCATFKYATNQHSRYVARSVVDASYVTGLTCTKVDKNIASQGQIIYRNATQLTGCCNMFYCDALPSFSFGRNNIADGIDSAIFGGTSNIVCNNNVCSAIIGGTGNVICSGNSRSVILGGNATILTGTTYIDTVAVPNLAIFCTPVGVGNVLAWDCVTKLVCLTSASGSGTITGATNGLHTVGANILLGGELTECTSLFGDCLDIKGVSGLNIRTTGNTDMNIDAQQAGGFAIKSQFCKCPTFTDFSCAIGFFGHVEAPNGFAIYDNRTGTTQTGIVYANDYSLNYVARSLVDKQYVDTVATGLNVHIAVFAATTSGITLSGSPKVIDGVTVNNGQRVLVKNQGTGITGSPFNGIYVVTGTTWNRASDYDNTPPGEVTNGDLIPVTSGLTQNSSLWALATPNPITVGVTPLIFTEFSTIVDVQGGNGICVTQSGGVHSVNVQLGTCSGTGCGLAVNANGLCVNSSIAGNGLTYSTGIINVNAATGGTISAIPVRVNAGNCLVVDCSSINAITGATNGLTRCGNDVWLGGKLIANTCINLSGDNFIVTGNTLGASFGLDVRPTEINIGDYNSAQLDYIHHTQTLTIIAHSFSGSCCNSSIVVDYLNTCMHQAVNNFSGDFCINCGYVCMNSQCTGGTMMCTTICPIEFNIRSINAGSHCLQVTTGSTLIFQGVGSNNAQICLNRCNVCMSQALTNLSCNAVCLSNGSICLYSNICNTSIGDIILSGNSMCIAGSAGFQGLKYVADNSANFITRSLPDVAYVTGKTSLANCAISIAPKAITGVTNGLIKIDCHNARLGGCLTQFTELDICGTNFFQIRSDNFSNCFLMSSGSTILYANNLALDCSGIISVACTGAQMNAFDSTNVKYACVTVCHLIPRTSLIAGVNLCHTEFLVEPNSIMIFGCTPVFPGAQYCADYSANFTARSLVDVAYVTGKTCTSGIQTANNGLCKQGTNVRLGGSLTGNTTIDLATFSLKFNNGCVVSSGTTGQGFDSYNDYKLSGNTFLSVPRRNFTYGNLAIGYQALKCNGVSCRNIAIGYQALSANTTECNNIAIGYQVLLKNTTNGRDNIGIGSCALYNNICGTNNIGIGTNAICSNIRGSDNIGIGWASLESNTCGSDNIAIGLESLLLNISGGSNIAMGLFTLLGNTTGCYNIAQGCCAMYCNKTGNNNIAMGVLTLRSNTGGTSNIAMGYCAMYSNTIGCNNIALGYQALSANTCGNNNIVNGYQALSHNTTGCNNIALGCCAMYSNICGCHNITQGYQALVLNICGNNNIALGYQSLSASTCTCGNIALGCKALSHNTTGLPNIAIGDSTLICNTTGCYDIAIGTQALFCNICGCYDIAIGGDALHFNTCGLYNMAIGAQALQTNTSGNFNTAFGFGALFSNNSGCNNIAIGSSALCSNSTGCNNIAIGVAAGCAEIGSNKLYVDISGTVNPLIYGDFSTRCIIVNGILKISGVTNGTCSNCILVWDTSTHEVKKVPFTSGSTSSKNNIYSKTIITGNTLLTTGSSYVILVSGTSVIVTLPSTPISGQAFKIKDVCGIALTNNIIINSGAGKTIDGSQCAIINTNYGAMEVMFGATCKWFNLSFIN